MTLSTTFDIIAVQDALAAGGQDGTQTVLSFGQLETAQVLAGEE